MKTRIQGQLAVKFDSLVCITCSYARSPVDGTQIFLLLFGPETVAMTAVCRHFLNENKN